MTDGAATGRPLPPLAAGTTAGLVTADVAVVGAGPAGIAAACRAAEAGARVVVVDEAAAPGGQVWRQDSRLPAPGAILSAGAGGAAGAGAAAGAAAGRPFAGAGAPRAPEALAAAWLERFAASGALWIGGAAVIDVLTGPVLLVDGPHGPLRVAAPRLVLATGARELFLPFPGWTLPNVVGPGGAQALLKAGAAMRGRRAVVAGSGPLLLPVAAALAGAGARIALVAEQAPAGAVARFAAGLLLQPRLLAQAVRYRAAFRPARYRRGTWVREARGGTGAGAAVREAVLTDGRRTWSVPCDLLACAYGLVPNLELPRLLGCALAGGGGQPRAVRVDAWQQSSVPGVYCAGELTGIGGLELALVSGQIAGLAAAAGVREAGAAGGIQGAGAAGGGPRAGAAVIPAAGAPRAGPLPANSQTTATALARELRRLCRERDRALRHAAALERTFRPRAEVRRLATPETLVCRCEDVPLGRLDPAWTPRQAKLYTRVGMGPCQGRVCAPALAALLGWDEPDTVRPPLQPVALAALAGLCDTPPAAGHDTPAAYRGD